MSEFKGTKGEWKINNQRPDGVLKDISCPSFSDWFIAQSVSEYDAQLIADAGNVRQQIDCSLTELLERYNESQEALKEIQGRTAEGGQLTGNLYAICEKAIKNTTT